MMGLFNSRNKRDTYQGFAKYNEEYRRYQEGLIGTPNQGIGRSSSLTSGAGQAAAAALRRHNQGQTSFRSPQVSLANRNASGRSNSLRTYTYNPVPSYSVGPPSRTASLRSNSIRSPPISQIPQRRNSINSTRVSRLGLPEHIDEGAENEDQDVVVTTTTTRVLDSLGRTSSITTKSVRTLPDGSNVIETTTKNISRSNSLRSNSMRNNSLRHNSLLSNSNVANLGKIDEALQDFDYSYELDSQRLDELPHKGHGQSKLGSPLSEDADLSTLPESGSEPYGNQKSISSLDSSSAKPLKSILKHRPDNDSSNQGSPQHPYKPLVVHPLNSPSSGSRPQGRNVTTSNVNEFSPPRHHTVENSNHNAKSNSSVMSQNSSIKFAQEAKTIPIYNENEEEEVHNTHDKEPVDMYAKALEAAKRKVYGDRDPDSPTNSAGGLKVAQGVHSSSPLPNYQGVEDNYVYQNHHRNFVGHSLRDDSISKSAKKEKESKKANKKEGNFLGRALKRNDRQKDYIEPTEPADPYLIEREQPEQGKQSHSPSYDHQNGYQRPTESLPSQHEAESEDDQAIKASQAAAFVTREDIYNSEKKLFTKHEQKKNKKEGKFMSIFGRKRRSLEDGQGSSQTPHEESEKVSSDGYKDSEVIRKEPNNDGALDTGSSTGHIVSSDPYDDALRHQTPSDGVIKNHQSTAVRSSSDHQRIPNQSDNESTLQLSPSSIQSGHDKAATFNKVGEAPSSYRFQFSDLSSPDALGDLGDTPEEGKDLANVTGETTKDQTFYETHEGPSNGTNVTDNTFDGPDESGTRSKSLVSFANSMATARSEMSGVIESPVLIESDYSKGSDHINEGPTSQVDDIEVPGKSILETTPGQTEKSSNDSYSVLSSSDAYVKVPRQEEAQYVPDTTSVAQQGQTIKSNSDTASLENSGGYYPSPDEKPRNVLVSQYNAKREGPEETQQNSSFNQDTSIVPTSNAKHSLEDHINSESSYNGEFKTSHLEENDDGNNKVNHTFSERAPSKTPGQQINTSPFGADAPTGESSNVRSVEAHEGAYVNDQPVVEQREPEVISKKSKKPKKEKKESKFKQKIFKYFINTYN